MFTQRELTEEDVHALAPQPLKFLTAPFEAAPIILPRDMDADTVDLPRAQAEVTAFAGPRAGFSYREWLRTRIVSHDDHHVTEVVADLMELEHEDLRDYISARPDVLSDGFQHATEQLALAFPEQAVTYRALGAVLQIARDDPANAWQPWDERLRALGNDIDRLRPDVDRLIAAHDEHRFDEVLADAPALLDEARDASAVLVAGLVAQLLAGALLETASPDYADHVERAIELMQEAIAFSERDATRAVRMMQLGLAYLQRVRGDHRRNLDEAIALMSDALEQVPFDADSDRAWIQTNLAHALLLYENGDDPLEALRAAQTLCEAALEWRSPGRDIREWAYTVVTLARAREGLMRHGRGNARRVRTVYEKLLAYADELPADGRVLAEVNLARLTRAAPVRRRTKARERRVEQAGVRLRSALEDLTAIGPLVRGQATAELAYHALESGDRASAIAYFKAALDDLRPELAPQDCGEVARELAPLLAAEERWAESAAAWADAVAAGDLTFYGRTTAADRERDLRARGNTSRWAAFAIAKAGDLQRAAVVLEDGRTRELRLRLGVGEDQLDDLRAAAPLLHDEYIRSLADLAHTQLLDDADAIAARHPDVLDRIRSLDGFEDFGGPIEWPTLEAMVANGPPLMYVNPAPWGTLLLTLSPSRPPRACFLDITSRQVAMWVMLGLDAEDQQVAPSFLGAAAGNGTGLDEALGSLLGSLGATITPAIAEELDAIEANEAALVVCGVLGQVPLHLAAASRDAGTPTLADRYDVMFAPSASLWAHARKAAVGRASSNQRVLVALADPRGGNDALPAARAEVRELARQFDVHERSIAVGPEATSGFLRKHAAGATYLHLAAHATGALFGYQDAYLKLADQDVPLAELARLGPLASRLAVASACQTASPDSAIADEGLSIGTILLAAGSAAAVAALWSVDDLATAILMTRFYEELFDGAGRRPPQALYRAQVWLRGLSREEAEAFVSAHPELRGETARRRGDGEGAVPGGDYPFEPLRFWAGFVAMGT